jgi:hypothetical protein
MAADISEILWNLKPELAAVPMPIAASPESMKRVVGTYQFDSSFYQPNARARIELRDKFLMLVYPTLSVPLIPIEGGEYFDRFYWSFVRFEDGKLIYRNGNDTFVAPLIADSSP